MSDIISTRLGQLPSAAISLTDNFPHEVGTDLKRATVQELATFISTYASTLTGVSFNPTKVLTGQTLPTTNKSEFLLAGKGTYSNVGGGADVVLTEELNALFSNSIFWSLGVAIPVNIQSAVVQSIRDGFTTTSPSENVLFDALALKLNISDLPPVAPTPPSVATGLSQGGLLTINTDNTKFNLSAGSGYIINGHSNVDIPFVQRVNWNDKLLNTLANIGTQKQTYIAIDINGEIFPTSVPLTPTEKRNYIRLGVIIHNNNTTIEYIDNQPTINIEVGAQFQDLIDSLGFRSLSGNRILPVGTNLKIKKELGKAFKPGANFNNLITQPHSFVLAAQNPITFRYRTQTGVELADTTDINPGIYDVNGTITAMPSTATFVSIQRIYIFQDGSVRVQPGQRSFVDINTAINNINSDPFITDVDIENNALYLGAIAITRNNINLSTSTEVIFIPSQGTTVNGSFATPALGYTAEDAANKQNNLTVDGTGAKYPTVDAVNTSLNLINKRVYFVTAEEYGAVGDGVTNDLSAIQNAVNSGKPVKLGAKIYAVNSAIQMPFRSSISGLGELSRIKTSGNYNAFEITGGDCSIFSLGILGSGAGALNNGIFLDGLYPASSTKTNVYLSNLYFNGFGNAGILFKSSLNSNFSPTCLVSNIFISGCLIGIDLQERAEYSTFTNCVLNQNNVGIKISGGNNNFIGGQITKNAIGVNIIGGDNNGHSNFTGTAINHNSVNSFKIENLTNGYLIDGCMLYDGNIEIVNCNLVKFTNSDISIAQFNTNTSNIELIDNKFISNPTFNLNLSSLGVSTVRFFNNTFVSGTIPTEATSELKGGLRVGGLIKVTDLNTIGFYQARLSDVKGSGSFGGNSFSIRNGLSGSENLNFDIFNRTSSAWFTPLIFDNNGGAATFASSVTAADYKIPALNPTPASATATGTLGQIRYDANYIYLCTATNTWKRSLLSTW
jgi:hypothetical protein